MTIQDLKALIDDTIKVHPDATDTDKLQGYKHKILLNTIIDFFASGAGAGDFPFDWTVPSNAFGGYSNSEKTFAPGMWKFLHRDSPPSIVLEVENPDREKGQDNAVTLHYSARAGSAAITEIAVDTQVFRNPSQYTGTIATSTAPNTNTTFTASVKDANGASATAGATVSYREKRVAFTSALFLAGVAEADLSAAVRAAGGELADNRYFTSIVNCNNSKLYVAYPFDFAEADKIMLNDFEDNSFSKRLFQHTNNSGFTSTYILYISENELFGDNKIEIK